MLRQEIKTANNRSLNPAPLIILQQSLQYVQDEVAAERFVNIERVLEFLSIWVQQLVAEYAEGISNNTPHSWRYFFEKSSRTPHSIRHLFAGLNLLLNFQFGNAAIGCMKSDEHLLTFETDGLILLSSIGKGFSSTLMDFKRSKPLSNLLKLAGVSDHHFGSFSTRKAIQHAWVAARRLATSDPAEVSKQVEDLDNYVVVLHRLIYEPGIFLKALLFISRA